MSDLFLLYERVHEDKQKTNKKMQDTAYFRIEDIKFWIKLIPISKLAQKELVKQK